MQRGGVQKQSSMTSIAKECGSLVIVHNENRKLAFLSPQKVAIIVDYCGYEAGRECRIKGGKRSFNMTESKLAKGDHRH